MQSMTSMTHRKMAVYYTVLCLGVVIIYGVTGTILLNSTSSTQVVPLSKVSHQQPLTSVLAVVLTYIIFWRLENSGSRVCYNWRSLVMPPVLLSIYWVLAYLPILSTITSLEWPTARMDLVYIATAAWTGFGPLGALSMWHWKCYLLLERLNNQNGKFR